jgi:hypothetical protein
MRSLRSPQIEIPNPGIGHDGCGVAIRNQRTIRKNNEPGRNPHQRVHDMLNPDR